MKKAICIPTYNRPEAIDELLLRYKDLYQELNYDLYIYDSSTNDHTYEVASRYMDESETIFYTRVDSSVHSNMKVYLIYEEFMKRMEYAYIWVQSDSIRWTAESLRRITDVVDSDKYSFVIPNYRDVENIGDKEYSDYNLFFRDCAWHMTLYGATIIKIQTVLAEVDWKTLKEKYGKENCINFSHVGLYFEQIAKMKCFNAYHLGLPLFSLTSTLYKKESGWRKDTFFILCECWPSVIRNLPNEYRYKEDVIKKNAINSGDFTFEGIKQLRIEGVLNKQVLKKYGKMWNEVSNVPLFVLQVIAILPQKLGLYVSKRYWFERKLKTKMKKFCSKFSEIYIYGCGQKGDIYGMFMEEMNISYKGFLISKGQHDKTQLRGKPVIEYDSRLLDGGKTGIILAVNENNFTSIIKVFSQEQISSYVFCEYL